MKRRPSRRCVNGALGLSRDSHKKRVWKSHFGYQLRKVIHYGKREIVFNQKISHQSFSSDRRVIRISEEIFNVSIAFTTFSEADVFLRVTWAVMSFAPPWAMLISHCHRVHRAVKLILFGTDYTEAPSCVFCSKHLFPMWFRGRTDAMMINQQINKTGCRNQEKTSMIQLHSDIPAPLSYSQ